MEDQVCCTNLPNTKSMPKKKEKKKKKRREIKEKVNFILNLSYVELKKKLMLWPGCHVTNICSYVNICMGLAGCK